LGKKQFFLKSVQMICLHNSLIVMSTEAFSEVSVHVMT